LWEIPSLLPISLVLSPCPLSLKISALRASESQTLAPPLDALSPFSPLTSIEVAFIEVTGVIERLVELEADG